MTTDELQKIGAGLPVAVLVGNRYFEIAAAQVVHHNCIDDDSKSGVYLNVTLKADAEEIEDAKAGEKCGKISRLVRDLISVAKSVARAEQAERTLGFVDALKVRRLENEVGLLACDLDRKMDDIAKQIIAAAIGETTKKEG